MKSKFSRDFFHDLKIEFDASYIQIRPQYVVLSSLVSSSFALAPKHTDVYYQLSGTRYVPLSVAKVLRNNAHNCCSCTTVGILQSRIR